MASQYVEKLSHSWGEEVEVYEEEYFEFKPCPFCGEKHRITLFQENDYYYISCLKCKSRGPETHTMEGAELFWNRFYEEYREYANRNRVLVK